MSINANSIKLGNVINYKNNYYQILKTEHVKPGKGPAYVQMEMKDIKNDTKLNIRFGSNDNIDKAFITDKEMQYQYMDKNNIIVMDLNDYEQHNLDKKLLNDNQIAFLEEGMIIILSYCDDIIFKISLPKEIEVEVTYADSVVKNQTSSSSYKNAIIKNDINILVPPFIEKGDKIIINSNDISYISKKKK